ncbi:MAG: sulfotransferase domain-containing protein, partial [Planctomycetes bacterium]|nr:sulfotransferase domain-containing protein [Planctomycetota bacterium]
VYRCMAGESPDMIYMKVHDAWGRTDMGVPLFPADVTAGVVYIIRNPLDIVMSAAYHWGSGMEKAVENLCNLNFNISSSSNGLSDQLSQRLRSWSGHVKSWIDESGLPVYPVRYEDMLLNGETTFKGVVRFCGLAGNDERIRKAVAFSDFSELQRQEREKGFRERTAFASGPFFRRGRVSSWREELTPDLVKLEEKIFLFSHTKTRRHKDLSQSIFFVILCASVPLCDYFSYG